MAHMKNFMRYRNINERIMYNMSDEHEGRKHQLNLGDEVMVLPTADGTLELGLERCTLLLLLLIPHPIFSLGTTLSSEMPHPMQTWLLLIVILLP